MDNAGLRMLARYKIEDKFAFFSPNFCGLPGLWRPVPGLDDLACNPYRLCGTYEFAALAGF
jgi:hypothetical protein